MNEKEDLKLKMSCYYCFLGVIKVTERYFPVRWSLCSIHTEKTAWFTSRIHLIEWKMNELKKHIPVLEWLKSLSTKEQVLIIKNSNRALLEVLSAIALNLIKKNIPLSPRDIVNLRKHEHSIMKLSQRKHSLGTRRKILQKGGFLSSLLSILPALVGGVLSSLS